MAYDKEKLKKQSIEAIEQHNLFFIEDIVSYLPCSKATFYDHFPAESDELNDIKELLDVNKVKEKVKIRKQLGKSEKAAELLALYRLIATPEEHKKLNQSYVDHTTKDKEISAPTINYLIDKDIHDENDNR